MTKTTTLENTKKRLALAAAFKKGVVALLGPVALASGCATASAAHRTDRPALPVAAAPEAAKPTKKVYDVVIDATSDWATIWIEGGRFIRDNDHAFTMETPAGDHVWKLTFAPDKIELFRKQFGGGHVIIKAQIETTSPSVRVTIGHGDNGSVLASSPVDTVHNATRDGSGQNRYTYTLDLAAATKKLALK